MASMLSMGAASVAFGDTVHFEAEAARIQFPFRGTITSPLMIKDDPAASGGSYVTVAPGNNSSTTAPASTTEGVARYQFTVAKTAAYRIWARVSAPTTDDDSFWVRMEIGQPSPPDQLTPWIRWNGIPLGSAYHWVLVKAEGASSAQTYNLTAGPTHELHIAYREDGTKIDAFYITDDTTFNPASPPAGTLMAPEMQPAANGGGSTKISWSSVPGASSYTVEKRPGDCSFSEVTQCCEPPTGWVVVASGLVGHKFTEVAGGGQYRVTAVGPGGVKSTHPASVGPDNCYPFDPSVAFADSQAFHWRAQVPVGSVTPPMVLFSDGGVGAPAGTDSTSSVPAHGRMRMDFELAAPATMRMWAEILAPTVNQDSFWVRWDDGTWINWNNLAFCSTLWDSGKSGQPIVKQALGAGSHRIEWAYRQGGARLLDNIILLEDYPNQGEQCSD